jgi:DNA-binding Lrp family transcriptional regulator
MRSRRSKAWSQNELKGLREVLQLLEDDARQSPAKLGELSGLSAATVRRLIERAEADGIIRRYKGIINWELIGQDRVFAFIEVRAIPERGRGFDAVAERLLGFPEVHSLYLMSGDYDLHVVVQGETMREVAYFVADKLAPLEGVQSTATHFVLKRYKVDGDALEEKEEVRRLPVSL